MYYVFPARWVTSALAAAACSFGPLQGEPEVKYRELSPNTLGDARAPLTIDIDKRPAWKRETGQCVIIHEYGHLAGREHSKSKRSIMYPKFQPRACHRYLVRHGLSKKARRQ